MDREVNILISAAGEQTSITRSIDPSVGVCATCDRPTRHALVVTGLCGHATRQRQTRKFAMGLLRWLDASGKLDYGTLCAKYVV